MRSPRDDAAPDLAAVASLTILSNGHGEDAIGTRLAVELRRQRPDLDVRAFPTVSDGAPYRRASIPVVGPAEPLRSGGSTLHSVASFVGDMASGWVGLTARQVRDLARLRTDVIWVVGDIYALALSMLVRPAIRFQFQPLVSAWLSEGSTSVGPRFFMENISYPERAMMRHGVARVYARDARTAAELRTRGVAHVDFLGNPIVDGAQGEPLAELAACRESVVALLPGSRSYAGAALARMLEALAMVEGVRGAVAWVGADLPDAPGWRREASDGTDGRVARYVFGARIVDVYERRFADVLASADAAIGTTGTANEQAAALGLPVVTYALPPAFTPAFVRNQKRLLGPALTVVGSAPSQIAAALRHVLTDPDLRDAAARVGPERFGAPGGTEALARDVLARADALGAWRRG